MINMKNSFEDSCQICGSAEWRILPEINANQSVRTDGGIVAIPLAKAHCKKCGLLQRSKKFTSEDALEKLYKQDYSLYDNRPGAEKFDVSRYSDLSKSILSASELSNPKLVLEIGCGNGSLLANMKTLWPLSQFYGLEPSSTAVAAAQNQGLEVYQGLIGKPVPTEVQHKYDFIYGVHVFEHVADPENFLNELRAMLAPGGKIYLSCPDGSIAHAEMIHPDHLYSMTSEHVGIFAKRSRFFVEKQGMAPTGDSLEFSQFVVLKKNQNSNIEPEQDFYLSAAKEEKLWAARSKYIETWTTLENALFERMAGAEKIYCFGAGGWAALLAGYTPNLWNRIEACIIDGGSNQLFNGKKILDYTSVGSLKNAAVLAGVNPATQSKVANKLNNDSVKTITFEDLIEY